VTQSCDICKTEANEEVVNALMLMMMVVVAGEKGKV